MDQVIFLARFETTNGPYRIRIDPAGRGWGGARRHAHVTKRGEKWECTWNEDGSRHDKRRFPTSEGAIQGAKAVAADVLGIDINVMQLVTGIEGGQRIAIGRDDSVLGWKLPLFNAYVSSRLVVLILGTPDGLAVVITDRA